jgi:hypothetical protein
MTLRRRFPASRPAIAVLLADRGKAERCLPGDGGQCAFFGYTLRRRSQ